MRVLDARTKKMKGGEVPWCYDTFRMADPSSRAENRAVPILSTGHGERPFTTREFLRLRRGSPWPENNP
jgi:hypothetical protein